MPYKLSVYIAEAGTPLSTSTKPSLVGHMWWSIDDGSGPKSYGFAPVVHGEADGPGEIYTNDLTNYTQIYAKEDFLISADQYRDLKVFGDFPELGGFNKHYNWRINSCIDFAWQALRLVGINPHGFDGAIWPSWNKGYLRTEWEDYLKEHPQNDIDWEIDWKYTFDGQVLINPICKPKSRPVDSDANNHYQDAVTYRPRDPLAIDLTGDGIKTVAINPAAPILFDHNGDGSKSATGWLQGSDAWLVRDINSNGTIDSGLELFGVDTDITVNEVARKATNGFEALKALDNGDNVFSAIEASSKKVLLWRDLNQNGVSDAGELSTFADNGIVSIALNYTVTNTDLGGGNSITGKAVVTRSTGTSEIDSVKIGGDSSANNLNLADNPFYRTFPSMSLTAAAQALPEMRGSGSVRDLREAMSLTSTQATALVATVTQFKQATTRDAQMALVDQLIQRWGATSTLVTSASATTNATSIAAFAGSQPDLYKKIIALEQFNGVTSLTQWANSSTVNIAAPVVSMLNSAYAALKESIFATLVLQTRLASYFTAINPVIGDAGVTFDTSALGAKLETYKATDAKNALIDLVELNNYGFDALNSVGFDSIGKLLGWIDGLAADSPLRTTLTELNVLWNAPTTGTSLRDIYVGDQVANYFSAGAGDDLVATGGGNDRFSGEAGDDFLDGGSGNDNLYGNDGNDTLDGGVGNDYLEGDTGADTYLFGKFSGQDTIYSYDNDEPGDKPDTILLNRSILPSDVTLTRSADDLIMAINDMSDTLRVQNYFYQDGASNYAVDNIKFADNTIWNVAAVKTKVLASTPGNDTLYGYATADTISAGDGNDTIWGYAGNDSLDGGIGIDSLYGEDGNDTVKGGGGNDTLSGGNDNDSLQGNEHNDTLYGDAGNDTLDGGAGGDVLRGGSGADTYLFGKLSGQDTISNYDNDALGSNADTLLLAAGILPSGVTLSRSADDLIVAINDTSEAVRLQSYLVQDGASNNAVEIIKFSDTTTWDVATVKAKLLISTTANDTLNGYASNDFINGGDGQDRIYGHAGNDSLDGGNNEDYLQGGEGNDVVKGGSGNDIIDGNIGNDTLEGGVGNDRLEGMADNDILRGNEGNDSLYGDDGNDTMDGGTGNDYFSGAHGADVYLFGKDSGQDSIGNYDYDATTDDTILLSAGVTTSNLILSRHNDDLILAISGTADSLRVQHYFFQESLSHAVVDNIRFADTTNWGVDTVKAKVLASTAGSDKLQGYASNDTISGGSGNDILYGYAGDDVLDGGDDRDSIYGGIGNDRLQGNSFEDTLYGDSGNDSLTGGQGDDDLYGGMGNDDFIFGSNSGRDRLWGDASGHDRIVFKDNIQSKDVFFNRSYHRLQLRTTGEGLSFHPYPSTSLELSVDEIVFSDGERWNSSKIFDEFKKSSNESDWLHLSNANQAYSAQGGHDYIFGGSGNDSINGDAGNDSLEGGTGNDALTGGSDNDTLNGGEGDDTLDGGIGNDLLLTGAGVDTIVFGTSYGRDLVKPQFYESTGIAGEDKLLIKGNTADVVISASSSDELIVSFKNSSDQLTISNYQNIGSITFDDAHWSQQQIHTTLSAPSAGSNSILSVLNNALSVNALGGDDTVKGGAGNDYLEGGMGNDLLFGNVGQDTLKGGNGNDRLEGGEGDDIYYFGKGQQSDYIYETPGTAGNNVLRISAETSFSEVEFITYYQDLYVKIRASNEVLTIRNGADIDPTVKQVVFEQNSRILTIAEIKGIATIATQDPSFGKILGGDAGASLTGTSQNERIYGGLGNDTLDGGGGDDQLTGSAGVNTYVFGQGSGKDIIYSSPEETAIIKINTSTSDVEFSIPTSYSFNVLIKIKSTGESLEVAIPADEFAPYSTASWHATPWHSSKFQFTNETLSWAQLRAKLQISTPTDDVLAGTDGNDSFSGGNGNDYIIGGLGNDTLYGGSGDDIIKGHVLKWRATDDKLYGEEGDDYLEGDAGSDTLTGGSGNDQLNGGAGSDTYIYNKGDGFDRIDDFLASPEAGDAEIIRFGSGISPSDILLPYGDRELMLADGSGGISIATEFQSPYKIIFFDKTEWSHDYILQRALLGNYTDNELHGYASDDLIEGGGGYDEMYGGAGSDTLNGGYGADTMEGGTGDDTYTVDTAEDVVVEMAEDANSTKDKVNSSVSYSLSQSFTQGVENLILTGTANINGTGNALDNELIGNDGDNTLDAGSAGQDTLKGGLGNDTYVLSHSASIVELANQGLDLIKVNFNPGLGGYTLSSHVENATLMQSTDGKLTGNSSQNLLIGSGGNDQLSGNSGSDRLSGNAGNDTMWGDGGTDRLAGGSGNDTYVYETGDGFDFINNYHTDGTERDVLLMIGTNQSQIWLTREVDDLTISVIGELGSATVSNWFWGEAQTLDSIKLADTGKVLTAAKVDALVEAMSHFTPPVFGQTTLPANYQTSLNPVIAASWA